MSSIFSHLIRVSLVSSFTTQRTSFYQPSSSSSSTSSGKHDHYQHGIPGIPSDGKVVLLKNSSTGAQVYLVGTIHYYKESTQIVKKVINYVKPDTIAVELCESRAKQLLELRSVDDNLYTLYLGSKRARGGLSTKVGMFVRNLLHLWRGEILAPNCEFWVAMEEASRVGAGCFFIDQDEDVTDEQLFNLVRSSESICQSHKRVIKADRKKKEEDYTRSPYQELNSYWKDVSPETFKVIVEDRDKHMFMELRRFQGKIVAVVGIGHMDGIELLWERAENGEDWQPPANQKCGLAMCTMLV
ncbi:hypothetical protein MKW98_028290 [Papaver atlanticum]|uniref:TraB domain-containing protein n=1 Tax=Papaver atlanticum TaxID=357466 RepID=A0AAD4XKC6_9MAGN|nr:hypothetical protein MKW98_028290 [Papaver atlanticum]